jgi:hypothetical protein
VRRLFAVVLACALLLVACRQQARPEGVVESWLRSLNQGAAGRPDRYADDDVSQQVVPDWRDLDPGHLDRVEVAAATAGPSPAVGFRITDVDGRVTSGTAHLAPDGASWRVTAVDVVPTTGATVVAPTAAGTPATLVGLPTAWPVALAVGGALAAIALALLAVVRRRAAPAP